MTAPTDLVERLAKKRAAVFEPFGDDIHREVQAAWSMGEACWWVEAIAEELDTADGLSYDFPWSGSVEAGEVSASWLRSHLPTDEEVK